MSRQTIDDVIAQLDTIIERCHDRGSRLGYFPAMYRKTTLQVKEGLETGRFEDPARLERLDVVFAERYFCAFDQYERGQPPTKAWSYSFRMACSHRPGVIQHLLLGMNAHINLDLGIAAANMAPGSALNGLKHDFDEINAILGELIDDVQLDLAQVFPALGTLDVLGGALDERAFFFSVRKARSTAWHKAQILAQLPSDADPASTIRAFDRQTVRVAKLLCPPHWLSIGGRASADESPQRVREVIEALTD